MGNYEDDPEWADVEPLPQDDGGPNALAAIAYDAEYTEAMSYLRAVMAAGEHSERVLRLTEDVIDMNPAHYTVWLYRAKTLFAVGADLHAELEWVNAVALAHLKNYQIWHHRHTVVGALAEDRQRPLAPAGKEGFDALMAGEADFIDDMFARDAKNYHVWSYRQWLVRRFALWDSPREMAAVERLLREDVRNNSAWNHRWFLVFGRPDAPGPVAAEAGGGVDDDDGGREGKRLAVMAREMAYAEAAIRMAPQNQSPWNYLRGLLKHFGLPLATIRDFAFEFADLDRPEQVRSSHALDAVADICREDKRNDDAAKALDLLASKYDPIRSRYWMWKKDNLAIAAT